MRFGLVGTGPWAQLAHGPGLAACPEVDLVGVWGRNPERAADLARTLGTPAYSDFDSLLAVVDAVAFAVPPATQSVLALTAARAGKHLLLDKPVATTAEAARAVRDATDASGVSTVVFFTDRFLERTRAWFELVGRTRGWEGGSALWLTRPPMPGQISQTPCWKRESSALWTTGPHAVATLAAALGHVESVSATRSSDDLVCVELSHPSGVTSRVTLGQAPSPAAARFEASVWGDAGLLPMPARPDGPWGEVLAVAAGELVRAATTGLGHPVDVHFGVHVTEVLAEAQHLLDASPVP